MGKYFSVFQAELLSLIYSCHYLINLCYSNNNIEAIVFRVDCKSVIKCIENDFTDNSGVDECKCLLNFLSCKFKIEIVWIQNHVGFTGNELADRMAKIAVTKSLVGPLPVSPIPISLTKNDLLEYFESCSSEQI